MANPQTVAPTWINEQKPLAPNHLPGNLHCELAASNEDFPNVQTMWFRNGYLFFLAENLVSNINNRVYEMWRSPDYGRSWERSAAGTEPIPQLPAQGFEASWYKSPTGRLIHCVFQSVNPVTSDFFFEDFDLDQQTWTSPIPPGGTPQASLIGNIIVRKDRTIVVFYCPNGNSGRNTLWIAYSPFPYTTWTLLDAAANGDQTGITDIKTRLVCCALDAEDNIHFSYADGAAFARCTYQRFNADNTLGPFVNFSTLQNGGNIGQFENLLIFKNQLVQLTQLVNIIPGEYTCAVYVAPLNDPTNFVQNKIFSVLNPFTFPTHSQMTCDGSAIVIGIPIEDTSVPIASRHTVIDVAFSNDAARWYRKSSVLDPTAAPIPLTQAPNPAVWIGQVIRDIQFQMADDGSGIVWVISCTVCLNSTNIEAAFFWNFTGLVPPIPIIPQIPNIPIPFGPGPGPGGNPGDSPGGGGPGGGGHPNGGPGGRGPWSRNNACCFLCDQPKWTKLPNPILRDKSIAYARRTIA